MASDQKPSDLVKQSVLGPGTRWDPNALSPGQEFPRFVYHATKESNMISSALEEAELAPEWSRTYIHKDYPRAKYYWNGKIVTVKDANEESALEGRRDNTPTASAGQPRGPGRPPKWMSATKPASEPKRRGRPPGSRNKPAVPKASE